LKWLFNNKKKKSYVKKIRRLLLPSSYPFS
jgi:hypothetical protein